MADQTKAPIDPCPFCDSPDKIDEQGHLQTVHKEDCPFIPCAYCGSTKVHRHGSNEKFFVVGHKPGCVFGRITVMEFDSQKHKAWQGNMVKKAEVVEEEPKAIEQ